MCQLMCQVVPEMISSMIKRRFLQLAVPVSWGALLTAYLPKARAGELAADDFNLLGRFVAQGHTTTSGFADFLDAHHCT